MSVFFFFFFFLRKCNKIFLRWFFGGKYEKFFLQKTFEGLGWKLPWISQHIATKADPGPIEKVDCMPKLTKLVSNAFLIYQRKLISNMIIDEPILVPNLK